MYTNTENFNHKIAIQYYLNFQSFYVPEQGEFALIALQKGERWMEGNDSEPPYNLHYEILPLWSTTLPSLITTPKVLTDLLKSRNFFKMYYKV